jgi:hypothetical protein
LTSDPWQLENLAEELNKNNQEYLDSWLSEYKMCSGKTWQHLSSTATPFQSCYGSDECTKVQHDSPTKQTRSDSGSLYCVLRPTTSFVVLTTIAALVLGIYVIHA